MFKEKILRKVLSFVLVGLMLFIAIPAAALEESDSAKVSQSGAMSYTNPVENYSDYISYDLRTYEKYESACKAIEQGLKNMDEKIYVSDYNIPLNDIRAVFTAARHRVPDLFYVENSCSYGYYNTTKVIYISPVYSDIDREQLAAMQEEFYEKADWYLSKVDDSMTDFQKALILHDALALDCYFDYNYSVYNLAINGFGQCMTYTWLYSYLLSQVGIKNEVVTSILMNHAWNKVCIDSEYYNVDVTWDDPINDRLGHVSHTYFLLSDNAFSVNKTDKNGNLIRERHYGYLCDHVTKSTRYDNYDILHEIDSKFCYVNDALYCVDNQYNSAYEKSIIKYNENDDSAEKFNTVPVYWSAGGSSYWQGSFMSLDEHDGILYYNTDNTINYYDIKNDTFEEYQTQLDMNNSCFGLMIKGTSLYAAIAENPNVTGTWEYVGECVIPKTQLATQPSEPQWVRGDADGDGELTIADATVIQRYLAKIKDLNETQKLAADFDCDGIVTIIDVTLIQRALAGLSVF